MSEPAVAIDPTVVKEWKRYPAYKDSGVEWLGEVPEGWDVTRVKRNYEIQLGKMLQNAPSSERDVQVPYLKAVHVCWDDVIISDLPEMWAMPQELNQYGVKDGDLLVCEGGEVGRAGIVHAPPKPCIIQNALHRVRPRENGNVIFLKYALHAISSCGWFDILCNKATIAHFTREKFAELPIPLPPLSEQRAIAAFLDRETARIDTLVEKKRRLIDLLAEKRQALITHAVTKGLDPSAERKDSGVEWIGEVPKGWKIIKNGRLIDSIDQGWSPQAEDRPAEQDEWAVIKLNAISKGKFLPYQHKVLSKDYDGDTKWKINAGDFLITRSNTPNLVGDVCLVDQIGNAKLIISDLVFKLNYRLSSVNLAYTKYWMLSEIGRYQIKRDARGSSRSMVKISQQIVKSWYVLLPPLPEQHSIAAFLDQEATRIDTITDTINQQIERLHEYRTALISAAVTGKIDVREEVEAV